MPFTEYYDIPFVPSGLIWFKINYTSVIKGYANFHPRKCARDMPFASIHRGIKNCPPQLMGFVSEIVVIAGAWDTSHL